MAFRLCVTILVAAASLSVAQDENSWVEIHRQDEAKWAQQSGLSPFTVSRLWRMASHFADASDDDSRIQLLETSNLGHNHILLVTYAGPDDCLNLTVFAQTKGYEKIWMEDQTPDGVGFCGEDAKVRITTGTVTVSIRSKPYQTDDARTEFTNYSYEWNGKTYRFAGKWKTLQGTSARDR